MSPTGREIARWLNYLSKTAGKYRKARTQEMQPCSREKLLTNVPKSWPSNHTRVLAFLLARDAGCGTNWGTKL